MGGMVALFSEISHNEYNYSAPATESLVKQIVKQKRKYTKDPNMPSVKNGIKKNKHQRNEKLLNKLQIAMSDDEIRHAKWEWCINMVVNPATYKWELSIDKTNFSDTLQL